MKLNIAILGSTGSIGKSTIKSIRILNNRFNIKLLSTNNNISLLLKQAIKYKVKNVIILNRTKFEIYKKKFQKHKIKVYFDFKNLHKIFNKRIYYTINAISGISGLDPTLSIIKHTKNLAIANKESIICGWHLLKKKIIKHKVHFIPVDSEHFSIWNLIKDEKISNIKKIYLTASGGPLLKKKLKKNQKINPKLALRHPNWKMGKKISIDSATMMNKVFELIEAKKIFDLKYNKLSIIIHPESYVHSIIHFNNGLVKFLAHQTKMEIPIMNSISKNEIMFRYNEKDIDPNKLNNMSFLKPDRNKFMLLKILNLLKNKDSYFETILIIVNDYLVYEYLNKKLDFFKFQKLLLYFLNTSTFKRYYKQKPKNINDINNMKKKVERYLSNYFKNEN